MKKVGIKLALLAALSGVYAYGMTASSQINPTPSASCCSSGNSVCCGNTCSAGGGGCKAGT